MLPALIMGLHVYFTANYAYIDDGVSILSARGEIGWFFKIGSAGRFMPGYWLYFWSMLKVLPESPMSLAFGCLIALLAGAFLCYSLARLLQAPEWAAVAAAWLATLNIAQVEASYTLSKLEPKQLLPWLLVFLLLERILHPGNRMPLLRSAALFICTALVALTKETGVLILVPIFIYFLFAFKERDPHSRTPRMILAAAAALPVLLAAIPSALQLLSPASYARGHVMQGESGLKLHTISLASIDWPLTCLLCAGLAGSAWLVFLQGYPARRLAVILGVQLLLLAGFFSFLRVNHPYYLVVPAALAAILAAAAVGQLRAPIARGCGIALTVVLLGWTSDHAITSASALTGWSWLYGRLTHEVVTRRPQRVVFYASGGTEVHVEARLIWNQVMNVPVEVVVLTDKPDGSGLPIITPRDLRPGDWIMEQFGEENNRSFPFRDLGIAWRKEFAIVNDGLQAPTLQEYRATFPVFQQVRAPWRQKHTTLSWRISVVTATPQVIIEGLTLDHWMAHDAKLWIAESRNTDVHLRFHPFAPPSTDFSNRLLIRGTTAVIADCDVGPSPQDCVITPQQFKGVAAKNGWFELQLSAEKTFNPQRLGLSADTRDFSFNFKQIYSTE